MKWVLSQQSLDHHRWLLQDAQQQTQFTYNLHNQSIRIKSKSNRLFFLEVAGRLFQKKIFLRSEYGVVIGEAQWTTTKESFLLLNEQKVYFLLDTQQLCFLDKHKNLGTVISIEPSIQLERKEQFALVFSSAWILSDLNSHKTKDLLVA